MTESLLSLGLIVALTYVGWSAYRAGRRHEREAQAEERERMSRIDPPARSPGQPTNLNAEPSVIRQPRFREARWTEEGDVQR